MRYLPEGNEYGESEGVNMRNGGERVEGLESEKWSPREMEERGQSVET